jgi:hypothetical protein
MEHDFALHAHLFCPRPCVDRVLKRADRMNESRPADNVTRCASISWLVRGVVKKRSCDRGDEAGMKSRSKYGLPTS